MEQDKLALGMIIRGTGNDAKNLRRALETAASHVDGVFVTITGPTNMVKETEKVCKDFNVNVSYNEALYEAEEEAVKWLQEFFGYVPFMKPGDKIFQFDVARNYNFSQIPKEYKWIMWMDSDDVLRRGENLRKVVDAAKQGGIEAMYFNYVYQADVDEVEKCVACGQQVSAQYQVKHVIIEHLRERLIANTGVFKWVSPIHETLIEQKPARKSDNYDVDLLHLATTEDRMESLQRNLKNLELAIYKSKGKDPRQIYYLAKALFDLRTAENDDKALPLIRDHYLLGDHKSGWPEERAQAWEYLAELYRRKGEHNNAIKACLNALVEFPEFPSIYLNLAVSYMVKQEWERALFWVRVATSIPEKKTTLVRNPRDMAARTLEVIFNCALNLSKVDEAWAAAVKLIDMFPEDENVKQAYQTIELLKTQRDLTKNIVQLSDFLKATGERAKIKPLLAAAPNLIKNNPFLVDLYQKNSPPTFHDENSIAIYCGPGFTTWSAKSLTNPGGSFVGGSEEAVINMAKELSTLGWKVTVYGDPGNDEGDIDGVMYLPYYKFNKLDHFNILIVWRQMGFMDEPIKAKRIYLWNHDIQNPLEYTKERLDKIYKVMFLSKWHRENVKELPEEKVFLTSNGL